MRLSKYLAAVAALSLTAAPAFADTNPAAGLSLSHSSRASSHSKHSSDLFGSGIIIAIVAVVAIGVGVGVAVSNSSSK